MILLRIECSTTLITIWNCVCRGAFGSRPTARRGSCAALPADDAAAAALAGDASCDACGPVAVSMLLVSGLTLTPVSSSRSASSAGNCISAEQSTRKMSASLNFASENGSASSSRRKAQSSASAPKRPSGWSSPVPKPPPLALAGWLPEDESYAACQTGRSPDIAARAGGGRRGQSQQQGRGVESCLATSTGKRHVQSQNRSQVKSPRRRLGREQLDQLDRRWAGWHDEVRTDSVERAGARRREEFAAHPPAG